MKHVKNIAILIGALIITACVSPIPLEDQLAKTNYKVDQPILISVIDKRTRVTHMEKSAVKQKRDADLEDFDKRNDTPHVRDPSFVGIAHGVYGIPSDWTVRTIAIEKEDKEKYLAELLQDRVVKGLQSNGWPVTSVKMLNPDVDEAKALLINSAADKLVALVINEWYFSINLNLVSAFNFDTNTDIYVYDIREGNILSKNITERDVVDEKYDDSFQNMILQAYKLQLDQLLNDPDLKEIFVH